MLARCLQSLDGLELPPGLRLIVQVVDNDALGSAAAITHRHVGPWSIHYLVEPERGLSVVRNRLLDAAIALEADYLAFLDDDEIAPANWLVLLWTALQQFDADIAVGPVFRIPWEVTSQPVHLVPERGRPTGSTPRKIACGNVLFARSVLGDPCPRFDQRLNFLGGEDHEFFARLVAAGAKAVWVQEAHAFEYQLPERQAWRYLAWRHFSDAVAAVARERTSRPVIQVVIRYGIKAMGKLLATLFAIVALPFAPRRRARQGLARLAAGIGYLAGVCGYRIERYRHSDGC